MSLMGDAYSSTTPDSASKKNITNVISGTGTYIAGLDKTKHKIAVVTVTGSSLTANHVYLASADGTTWIDLADIVGGSGTSNIIDLFMTDPEFFDLILTKTNDLVKAQWIQTVTSTGTIADDTDGTTGERSIKLLTGATSGSGSTISYPHLDLDFSKPSMYQTKVRLSATTALAAHTGVACDDVTAADSNTRKLQAELCTVTNGNWWLRTANGSANTASDTTIAFTSNRTAVKIIHLPTIGTPEADLYIDSGTVLQKTGNIPTSSTTTGINLIKHSLKNSTTADKNLYFYGCRLRYTVGSTWN
jgi:hypothetical protein